MKVMGESVLVCASINGLMVCINHSHSLVNLTQMSQSVISYGLIPELEPIKQRSLEFQFRIRCEIEFKSRWSEMEVKF